MRNNFEKCLNIILEHEGGFVMHKQDPGGATNMGVTQKTLDSFLGRKVTVDQVKNLSKDQVMPIYLNRYWMPIFGDSLPIGIDLMVFDAAVHSGPSKSMTWLQRALGIKADGIYGPQTEAALSKLAKGEVDMLIEKMADARLAFLQKLKHWPSFSTGWTRRLEKIAKQAKAMI